MSSEDPVEPGPPGVRDRPAGGRWWILIAALAATCFVLMIGALLSVAIGLPFFQQQREAARREQAAENLRQLGQAMQAYHQQENSFATPPTDADAAGPSPEDAPFEEHRPAGERTPPGAAPE
ncbi:DUF1559 domain-containing protein [Alienimonas chondri]|uniref:DUF1559 domain-containing protein n=1 Tax=Alienimonas chondri TaxID=2681879 RepID=A0ABX1VEG1_9PLAN|nr:DUF1559 domain-containing protein [Alienimonas chondri]NNJ26444.1 hypothetical protein [Alienimonas chondri]